MDRWNEEAERLLPCQLMTRLCDPAYEEICYGCEHRPAVAAALDAAVKDGKKKLAEMTHIRDFAIRCLIKATGATKEQVQAAPYELAVKIKAELVQLRAENERLKGDSAMLIEQSRRRRVSKQETTHKDGYCVACGHSKLDHDAHYGCNETGCECIERQRL